VQNLTFRFSADHEPALHDCNLALTRGSRCLLIGANGAGKSTILRLLAGKRMPTKDSYMRVFGKDVFHDAPRGITYLGTEWAMNPVVRSDIKVSVFLDSVGGYRHKERRDQLLDILDVDVNWRMHSISDGERRRVQLTMGLMEPWDLLLLDEVTVDLDVQVRADLLAFLTQETKTRGATIIYATHIFDGLQNFPTQVVHMQHGSITTREPIAWPPRQQDRDSGTLPVLDASEDDSSILLQTALAWLREDRQIRIKNEQEKLGKKTRGAKRGEETDSERFFSKYDYSQNVAR
jgi:CCR4-NOT complex subunit CAF16